jgi:glucan phosphoethanolaminetransferase (alkaline phosphatase superfamily)
MYHLATVFPPVRRIQRLPFSRDQLMLLMAAINEIFLSVDIYLAHNLNDQIKPTEWIPILFGVSAGFLLLLAGLLAFRFRPLATILANFVFLASMVVGVLGIYFHLNRTILAGDPLIQEGTVNALIWAPPILGPAVFILVGVLGISAAWIESPPDSGRLLLLGNRSVQMPYSKTRAYFFIVAIGILLTLISSVLDHARLNFENPWVWLPIMAGIFGIAVAVALGIIERPTPADLATYTVAMLLLILVGMIGFLLHLNSNLVAEGTIVIERFLRGSPSLAPMLFANMGLLGLIVLLDPAENT